MLQRVVRFTAVGILLVTLVAFTGCAKKTAVNGALGVGGAGKSSGGSELDAIMAKNKAVMSYTVVTTTDGKTFSISYKMKDGAPVRLKMDMGPQSVMLMQIDNHVQYMYNPATKTAMKMVLKDAAPVDNLPTDASKMPKGFDLGDLKSSAIKSDKIDGIDCWRIDYTGGKDSDVQTWVDKKYGLPIQEKMLGVITKHTYKNVNSVPDSEFELPAGTKIQDLEAMKNNIPNVQNMPQPGN